MTRAWVAVLAVAALLAGCSSDEPDRPAPAPERTRNEGLIRGWNAAINASKYEEAADFFARGAVVDQGRPFKLRSREAAVAFNRSLPCRAKVTQVREEGRTTLATFELRPGASGARAACDESVRVRFTIGREKFQVFEQLPGRAAPSGDPA